MIGTLAEMTKDKGLDETYVQLKREVAEREKDIKSQENVIIKI